MTKQERLISETIALHDQNLESIINKSDNAKSLLLQSFKVSNALVGSIDAGLCLLVGLTHEDTEKDLEEL